MERLHTSKENKIGSLPDGERGPYMVSCFKALSAVCRLTWTCTAQVMGTRREWERDGNSGQMFAEERTKKTQFVPRTFQTY